VSTKWIKWTKTAHKGLRYYEHPTRKHGKKKDRYYAVRFKIDGKDYSYGIGWWSGRIPDEALKNDPDMGFEDYALTQRKLYKANVKAGTGPRSPKEKREVERQNREAEEIRKAQEEKENLTFTQMWEDYFLIAKENKTKRAWQSEEGLYNHWIKPAIGNKSLRVISPIHLERLKKNMADAGRAARSIHYALAVVRQVFNYARNIGLYGGDNPVSKVKKPTTDNRRLRFLSHEEAARLLKALALKSTECHDMTLISLHAGLRFGEVAGLTWGDVNIDNGLMTLRDTKAGRNRMAYITQAIKQVLEAKTQGNNGELVFPGRAGKRKSSISNTFDQVVRELGFNEGITDPRQKVVFHTCRHTFASWLVQAGVDLYQVKALMGHSTISQTERYSHLAPGNLRNAVRIFEEDISSHVINLENQLTTFPG